MSNAMTHVRPLVLTMLLWASAVSPALSQDDGRVYAGGLFGVSTLSGDARSVTAAPDARLSLYKPENGPAVNAFAGVHLTRFLSLQANYIWDRNDLTLLSSFLSPSGGGFYEQMRESSQHAVVADLLLYFRGLGSGVRPYLSTGIGLLRFESAPGLHMIESGVMAPDGPIAATRIALRVAVGIDLAFGERWGFRYSFSETISANPISEQLMPPGQASLANFQNLFGFVLGL